MKHDQQCQRNSTIKCPVKTGHFILFTLLSVFSSQVFAEAVPIVRMDANECEIRPWHQLGGCFQNKTGITLPDNHISYRQTIYYTDKRTPITLTIPLDKMRIDKHIVISTSHDVIRRNHIKKVANELLLSAKIITGCQFEIVDDESITTLKLLKSENDFYCA